MNKPYMQARIRYDANWHNEGEHYVFEIKWSNEEEWGLEAAYPLINDCIRYTALTRIREWMKLGIKDIQFM